MPNNQPIKTMSTLYSNIKNSIDTSKHEVSVTVNSAMILAYWEIGRHLIDEIFKEQRATYGQEVSKKYLKRHIKIMGTKMCYLPIHHRIWVKKSIIYPCLMVYVDKK